MDYQIGYMAGYRDAQNGKGSDPVDASPDFRQGYLDGHKNGTIDKRAGVSNPQTLEL